MNKVAIVGYSTAKFRRSTDKSVYELACEPSMDILRSSNLAANRIEGLLFSSCSHDLYGGAILSEMLGVSPKLTCRIDNLCNSGTIAISTAYSYISSGLCDSVLVVGAELYNSPGSKTHLGCIKRPFYFSYLLGVGVCKDAYARIRYH